MRMWSDTPVSWNHFMPYSTKTETHFGNNDSLAGRSTRQNTVYQYSITCDSAAMIYLASFNHVSERIIDVWRYDNYSLIYHNSSWCDGGQTQHFSNYYCICLTVNKVN